MGREVAIIYNQPDPSRYGTMGEEKAILGVLDEVEPVNNALIELGYVPHRVPLSPPLEKVRETLGNLETDLVFNLFEGFDGRAETEATVAAMLEELKLTHTGCPSRALSLALDKARAKSIIAKAGVPTPAYQVLCPENISTFRLDFPCIVKPCAEDASHGLTEKSVVNDSDSLKRQVGLVSESFGGQALVEEFVDGREFNITVFGHKEVTVLPISEIVFSLPEGKPRILTFAAKWEPETDYFEGSKVVCPADISDKIRQSIARSALCTFKLLGCSGYARVDFRMSKRGLPKVIDINPNPDVSPEYGAALQAQTSGMTYPQFVEKILQFAQEKNQP